MGSYRRTLWAVTSTAPGSPVIGRSSVGRRHTASGSFANSNRKGRHLPPLPVCGLFVPPPKRQQLQIRIDLAPLRDRWQDARGDDLVARFGDVRLTALRRGHVLRCFSLWLFFLLLSVTDCRLSLIHVHFSLFFALR